VSQCADNFRFDVTAWDGHYRDGFKMLDYCVKLAFANHSKVERFLEQPGVLAKVEHGRRFPMWEKPPRLILMWGGDAGMPLLMPAGPEVIAPTIREWLGSQDYKNEPDHDGDNSKGWRIYNGPWGHIDDHRYAICAIEPAWLMHGK
jgi:hypothetical protein